MTSRVSDGHLGKGQATATQRVFVIHDASQELILSSLRWALYELLLKPGDKLIVLGVLRQASGHSEYERKQKVNSHNKFFRDS
ncbi:uncharacterized protein J3R85_016030 [Psidium guajava]|nr:uncharacterized protein J3R85_016030 [Psidium guajava]